MPIQQELFHAQTGFRCRATHTCRFVQSLPLYLHWHRDGSRSPTVRLPDSDPLLAGQPAGSVRCYAMLHMLLPVVGTSTFNLPNRSPSRALSGSFLACGGSVFTFNASDLTVALTSRGRDDITIVACLAVAITCFALAWVMAILQGVAQIEDDTARQVPQLYFILPLPRLAPHLALLLLASLNILFFPPSSTRSPERPSTKISHCVVLIS